MPISPLPRKCFHMNRTKNKNKPYKPARSPHQKGGKRRDSSAKTLPGGDYWLYGAHALQCALENDKRQLKRIVLTKNAAERLDPALFKGQTEPQIVERNEIDGLVGEDAVHQGMAALSAPLPSVAIEDIAKSASDNCRVLILDQVTDPHNVGAILRSAAIFGANAVILQDRHAPPETGVLAKSASGALEEVPLVRVSNLSRAIDYLKEMGFWSVGFAGEAEGELGQTKLDGKLALIMGAEGDGMRRLTRDHCDILLRIPMAENNVGSLNVSNAAAIALFATYTPE